MRLAIPLLMGRLASRFGHCDEFALIDIDMERRRSTNTTFERNVPRRRAMFPEWLHARGVRTVIACGIGWKAQAVLADLGIHVLLGAPSETLDKLVTAFLAGTLPVTQDWKSVHPQPASPEPGDAPRPTRV